MGEEFKRPAPRTGPQAKKLFSNDAIKKLVKIEIQKYLESFFNKAGNNFDLMRIVSPSSLKYNTDRSFDPATDPTQRRLQIARQFNELRAVLPSVLVMDGGIEAYAQSIGLIDRTRMVNGQWVGSFPITKNIPITVLFAARDMESADELSGVASLMFNELRNIAGGSYIVGNQDQGETWAIYLPNAGVSVGQLQQIDVEGDPVEKIFYAELAFSVFFEDVIQIAQDLPSVNEGYGVVNEPDLAQTHAPEIVLPDELDINTSYTLLVKNINNSHQIRMSDANIATLTHTMVINPRRFGSGEVIVLDLRRPLADQVVARKSFTVV